MSAADKVRRPPAPRLDEGAKNYYKRIEDYADDEGKGDIFFSNVVDQVLSDGVRLVSCDKDGSKALERCLQHSSTDCASIKKLMRAVMSDFFKISVNRCGSHVMETLLHEAGHILSVDRTRDEELLELFLSLISVVEEKLSEYIQHLYASHVLGSVVQDLGGIQLAEQIGRSRYSREFRKVKMVGMSAKKPVTQVKFVPDEFIQTLDRIAKKVSKLQHLKEMLTHQSASPVLQSLLQVLAQRLPERGKKLTRKIVKMSKVLRDGGNRLPDLFTDLVGSHLMETMIQVASPELHSTIFQECFKGQVMMSALHPVANFPLQRLIGSATPPLLVEIVPELNSLEDILFASHTGVVVKLMESAIACPHLQPLLIDAILKAFHTQSHLNSIAPVIMALMTYEVFYNESEEGGAERAVTSHPITLHGSLLLQAMLKFKDTKVVIRSILKMSSEELVRVSCDSNGSHIITTFMNSSTVPVKKRGRLIKRLEDHLVVLCVDKYGSRVVDMLWRMSEIGKKEELATVLLAHEEELTANFHGNIVLRNCNIAHFRKKRAGWLELQKTTDKRREIFHDILTVCSSEEGGNATASKRKRNRKVYAEEELLTTKQEKRPKKLKN